MEKKKILFVDDNAGSLKLGKAVFESAGYEVITAVDGYDAMGVFSSVPDIDLVVTDILMPNMDGYSLCYSIRQTTKGQSIPIPIIVYSATFTTEADEQRAIEIGADMFIRKPASNKMLLAAVEGMLSLQNKVEEREESHTQLSEVMQHYNSKLIEKLEQKNIELESAHAELIKSESRFRALIENNFDALSLHSVDGNVQYQSPATERMLGYTREETNMQHAASFFHPDDIADVMKRMEEAINNPGKPIPGLNRMKHKDGHYVWTEGTTTNMLEDENVKAIVGNFRDVTGRKLAEERLSHANDLYAFISNINKTIVHAKDRNFVFKEACRIAVEIGKFKMAWIGVIDGQQETVDLTESCGITGEDLKLFRNAPYKNGGPLHKVIDSGKPFICNDIENNFELAGWKDYALSREIQSFTILPILLNGQIVAAFSLYASEKHFFDQQETDLLDEVVGDISFALDSFEKEDHRLQMMLEIVHSENLLRKAQSIAHFGSWEYDLAANYFTWSDETCRIYGVSTDNNIQTPETWSSFIHPEDLERVLALRKEGYEKLAGFSFNCRIIRPDGAIRHIFTQLEFEIDENGDPVGTFGVIHDVTDIKEAEEKIIHANHLYAFISNINKTIVRAKSADTVFQEACRIAIEIGKFKIAYVGIYDFENKKMLLKEGMGIPKEDLHLFTDVSFEKNGPQSNLLLTESSFVCNDIESEIELQDWKQYAAKRDIHSGMVLPIKQEGKIMGSLNLYACEKHFFDQQEIDLLEEVAEDISFALDSFEKEKQRIILEEKIAHSELRLKQAQAIAHVANWEYDYSTGIIVCSEEYCRIYGLKPEDNMISAERWLALTHPDDLALVTQIVNEGDASMKDYKFDYRILLPDGCVKHIHSQTNFEFDKTGSLVGSYGIAHDITTQKIAEGKIISANRLYAVVSLVNQAIIRAKDPEMLFREVCHIAVETGKFKIAIVYEFVAESRKIRYLAGQGISEEFRSRVSERDYSYDGPQTHALRYGTPFICNDVSIDLRYLQSGWVQYASSVQIQSAMVLPVRRAGEIAYSLSLYSQVKNMFDQPQIDLLEGVAEDISFALGVFEKEQHRKQMEEKVVHSELLLKQAQALGHFGSWELDFATGLVEWTEETCRIYGLDPCYNIHTSESWMSLIHPDDRELVLAERAKGHETLTGTAFGHRIVRPNGEVRYLYSQSEFKFDDNGKPVRLVGVAHDITELKLAEAERTKMIDDIVQRNKDLEQFSYIVSHNLRAPVANISGLTQILQMPDMEISKAGRFIQELANSVKRLDEVILDLNDILQVKQKEVKKMERVAFSEMVKVIMISIDNLIKNNDLQIISDFTEIDEILTFKSYFHSIFFNLITNSIKYRQSEITPIIKISSRKIEDKVIVVFKDNGLGIDLVRKGNEVFGLYKRFHGHVAGKGMGLYMVKNQVESLGGKISISSEVNIGTEFTIEFPLNQ